MIYEGVNFNEAAVRNLTLGNFLSQNEPHLWKDRDRKTRRRMLEEVWLMVNPLPKKEQPDEKGEE